MNYPDFKVIIFMKISIVKQEFGGLGAELPAKKWYVDMVPKIIRLK